MSNPAGNSKNGGSHAFNWLASIWHKFLLLIDTLSAQIERKFTNFGHKIGFKQIRSFIIGISLLILLSICALTSAAAAKSMRSTPTVTLTSIPAATSTPANTPTLTVTPTLSIPAAEGAACIPPEAARTSAEVVRIVDGDTIVVRIDGVEISLRYIGMDTAESGAPGGAEATAKNTALVEGKTVLLYKDQSELDGFDRLLRYVFVEDTFVNYELIRSGFAEAKFWDDRACQQVFVAAEKQAKTAQAGIWAVTSTVEPLIPPTETSIVSQAGSAGGSSCPKGCTTPPPGCVIKGNINSKGVKIFHVPGGGSYDVTVITPGKGERWFCTEAEAVANGWRKARN